VSRRLAQALIDHIGVQLGSDDQNAEAWLLIEGTPPELAKAIVRAWPDALPPIFVAGPVDVDFEGRELGDVPATRLRNEGPMCLVICEGHRIADAQSVKGFDRYSPEDLLETEQALARLARQDPDVSTVAGIVAVQQALTDAALERPPSAQAVAAFLDAVASGTIATEALPELGGFVDGCPATDLTRQRVLDNLNLASGRNAPDRMRPASLGEIRARAERHLGAHEASAEQVLEMLVQHDDALLSAINFERAVELLEEPPAAGLADDVRDELLRFAQQNTDDRETAEQLAEDAPALADPFERRQAADAFLKFDQERAQAVFRAATRRRLRSLRRERSITADAIEEGLLRAIDGLPTHIRSLRLKEPQPLEAVSSEANAKAVLALAAAHVRAAPMLRRIQQAGVDVDGALLADPTTRLETALEMIDRPQRAALRRVILTARGEARSDTVEIVWTPGVEDIALLGCGVAFASGTPALELGLAGDRHVPGFVTTGLSRGAVPHELTDLAQKLQDVARLSLSEGFAIDPLRGWARSWAEAVDRTAAARTQDLGRLDSLARAGAVSGANGEMTLTHLSPLKAEWLAARTDAWLELLDATLAAAGAEPQHATGDPHPPPLLQTARAVAGATAAQYPAFVVEGAADRPLLPHADASLLSVMGGSEMAADVAPPSTEAVEDALRKLLDLHPEASVHLRCAAWLDSSCDLLMRAVLRMVQRSSAVAKAELVCFEGRPSTETLRQVDDFARGENRGRIAMRSVPTLQDWRRLSTEGPDFHFALVEGITREARRLRLNMEEVPVPPRDDDVLFIPKSWVRPDRTRMLLAPPRLSGIAERWYALMTALDDSWPAHAQPLLRIPEIRTDVGVARDALIRLHDLALWVVTLDRFANRESLEAAVGADVAILHQERRAAGSVVEGLVISQRSGGTADRAIARSIRRAGLVDETLAPEVAEGLRRAAAKGYGILALRAATTGSGVNELIGHVAAFHRLTTAATPWPLPPGCRILLLSLDEYAAWFGRARRADMLALALSPVEGGVHAANVEVKTVRDAGSARGAVAEAKEQLRRTLIDSRFAAYPNSSLHARLWLNRITEAAVALARENRFNLSAADLDALDAFRRGQATLEWAGLGMIFSPGVVAETQTAQIPLMRDRVPVVLATVPLDSALLRDAAQSDGTNLRTVATGRPTLAPSTKGRRGWEPGGARSAAEPEEPGEGRPAAGLGAPPEGPAGGAVVAGEPQRSAPDEEHVAPDAAPPVEEPEAVRQHPILGWDLVTREPVEWRVTGAGALSNGHMEVYGTSGAGKTQFIMSLLTQLQQMGSRFGVCDFKNDYGGPFPESAGAQFYDLWQQSLPFNPLAIDDPSRRALQGLVIELRDTVEIAARAFTRMGHRQLGKLQEALEQLYDEARRAGRSAPTLADLHELLDEDLRGVIGDLTGTGLFGDGPPLGSVIEQDVIFGLNHIPGTGLTTTLAAGFILSSLYLKLLEMPQVANVVKYTLVIDEAHRVASFHSVGNMIRELRSKGLAVILATQKPGDLPEEASTNAQTKVFLRLPDAQAARAAARALDPSERDIATIVRSLSDGEAYVSFAGASPQLVKLKQFWRDG
jgi:hypothetical protein